LEEFGHGESGAGCFHTAIEFRAKASFTRLFLVFQE
jgi:hypothetical protein